MPPLAAYLAAQAGRPFAWGQADCVTLIADWIRERRGIDPLGPLRGSYSDESSGRAHHTGYGGLPRAVGRALRRDGLSMTIEPNPGDVAVIVFGNRACCAIRTYRAFAVRFEDGLALLPPDRCRLVAAWSV